MVCRIQTTYCRIVAHASMPGTIKSVEKAIDLLFLFDGDRTAMDVKTIAASLGIPLRTTYRLATTLRNRDVLTIEEGTGLCRISPRMRRLLAAIDDSGELVRICGPFLTELARLSGETSQLFLPHGDDEVLLAETVESSQLLRVGPRKGQRIPLHCGAGAKPIFAFQPPERWGEYIRRNGLAPHSPGTVTDPQKLTRQLQQILRTRFVVSHQEFIPGVRSLGVPIQDATGAVVASLGLVGPDTRLTRARAIELKPLLLGTAQRITAALCGRRPAEGPVAPRSRRHRPPRSGATSPVTSPSHPRRHP